MEGETILTTEFLGNGSPVNSVGGIDGQQELKER